jgi:hypothetical protein
MRPFPCLPLLLLAACSTAPTPPKKEEAKPVISNEQAPDTYRVNLDTSKGPVVIEVTRAWAPRGADRFYNLVRSGFYDGDRFFRVGLSSYSSESMAIHPSPNCGRISPYPTIR